MGFVTPLARLTKEYALTRRTARRRAYARTSMMASAPTLRLIITCASAAQSA